MSRALAVSVSPISATSPSPISQALAAAALARRLAQRGDAHLSIALLCQALRLAPAAPLLDSAERWLTAEALRPLGARPLQRLAFTLASLAAAIPERGDSGRLLNLRAGLRLLGHSRALHPQEAALYLGEAFVRDKLGDDEGKLAVARSALEQLPRHWPGHVLLRRLVQRPCERARPFAVAS